MNHAFQSILLPLFLAFALAMVSCATDSIDPPSGSAGASTSTSTSTSAAAVAAAGKMIMEISGTRTVIDPNPDQIRNAVSGLDASAGPAFIILQEDNMTYLQVSGDAAKGFNLEYQENDLSRHYRATHRNLNAEQIIKTFIAYSERSEEWKGVSKWERMTF